MKNYILLMPLSCLLIGCSTSNHASFVPSSHVGDQQGNNRSLGAVTGESKQTWVLYLFPHGEAPSTQSAIQDAKSKIPGTRYLTDMTIDDRIFWGVGFYEQIIKVDAEARN